MTVTEIGRYRLVRLVARGGMGELWLATVDGVGGWRRRVALKRVLPDLEGDDEFLARFIDEARIAAGLSHGNIVPVFDMGEADGELYLAMEYVDGSDLRRILKTLAADGDRMPERIALFIAAELCAGLGYAHDKRDEHGVPQRIVHRDVSPSNVLVSRAGDVRLVDFGIASARDRLGKTVTGQLRGKFAYMSPEQASGRTVDRRSDLFSVGVLVFEMLTGVRPFEGDGDLETLARVQRGERASFAELRPDLGEDVAAVVERALSVDAAERYDRAEALQRDLLALAYAIDGPVTVGDVASWIDDRLSDDPVFAAHGRPGGATLDDLLNAQLDGESLTPSGALTGSGRYQGPISTSGRSVTGSTAPGIEGGPSPSSSGRIRIGGSGDHTVTRASVPLSRAARRRRRWALAVAAAGVLAVVGAWSTSGRLEVRTTPPGATVYLDDVELGRSPITADRIRGSHEVTIDLVGHVALTRSVTVRRGRTVRVEETLRPSGRVVEFHSVPPGATVVVGDRTFPAGNATRVPLGEPVRVEMTLAGYAPVVEEVIFSVDDSIFTRPLEPVPEAPGSAGVAAGDPSGTSESGSRADRGASASPERGSSGDDDAPRVRRYRLEGLAPSALVTVDGRPVEGGVFELAADATPVEVRAVANGAAPWTRTIDPRETRSGTIEVEMPAVEPGTLVVRFVEPPMVGEIEIDGTSRGTSDDLRESFALGAGTHNLRVVNTVAGKSFEADVEVRAGAEVTVGVEWR